jgi:putative ABC transport system permease protein
VSADFFAVIGATPALGRTFLPEEALPSNANRVVLSDGLWKRRFGGDPSIVGKPVLVDGVQSIVVGVMPKGFDFPMGAELWGPLAFDEKTALVRGSRYLTVIGRLVDGHDVSEARAQFKAVAERLQREYPDTNRQVGVEVYTLTNGMMDIGLPPILSLWQAAGLFVLLIACANIANLLLARGAERGREIAVRLALGSSRGRIVRESLIESALLAILALPLALAIAQAFLRLMHGFMPARIVRFLPGWNRLGVDARVIGITMICGAAATLVFGILPALHMARGHLVEALKIEGRGDVAPGRQRLRRGLVVAEIALALPLLVAAMLSISTVTRYLTGWQGYDPNNVLTARVVLPEKRYPDADSQARFVKLALDNLASSSGVRTVAAGNVLPAVDSNATRAIEIAGQPVSDPQLRPRVDYRAVTPLYFDALRMPVLAGRAFTTADAKSTEPVAIVSQSMADRFWKGRSAVGERLRLPDGPWLRVVGVCGDVVHDYFDRRNVPTMYRPFEQAPTDYMVFAIRTGGDPMAAVVDTRAAFARVDPAQPIFEIRTLHQVLSEKTIGLQYIAGVMGTFAGLAVMLAVLGLYAVMTYLVAQRVREIGVRIALGASASDVTRLTLAQAGRLTAIGVAIGLALAVALGRAMEAGLLGIVSSDIRLTLALALALAATSLAASYVPARRAASVDPVVALRSE